MLTRKAKCCQEQEGKRRRCLSSQRSLGKTGNQTWLESSPGCTGKRKLCDFHLKCNKFLILRAMGRGEDPRRLLEAVLPKGSFVPPDIDRITLWKVSTQSYIVILMRFWHSPALWFQVLFNLLSEPEKRRKLESVNTLEDVVRYLVSTNVFFW